MLNSEQFLSLFRTLLQIGGAYVVGRGWVDESTVTTLSAAVVTIVVTAWGLYARRNAGLVASAAALPEVKTIVASPSIVKATDNAKITQTAA